MHRETDRTTDKMKKLREATLLLHKKVGREALCYCGSKMVYVKDRFICTRQYGYKEPSTITVYIPDKKLKV